MIEFFKLCQLHRWFTYSFCHGGLTHLTMNIVSKALLGLFLEFQHKVCFVIIVENFLSLTPILNVITLVLTRDLPFSLLGCSLSIFLE